MSTALSYHVVFSHTGAWGVKKYGASRATKCFPTQQEAVDWGRILSRKQRTELFIHGEDGRVQCKDSHENNPTPPKDQ